LIDRYLTEGAMLRPAAGESRALGPETAATRIVEIIEKSRK
jgi:hypothetical protein